MSFCLKKEIPEEVKHIVRFLFDNHYSEPIHHQDHEFFDCHRWRSIGNGASYYFTPVSTKNLYFDNRVTQQYYITFRCDLKNYDGEIKKFLDWIMPYIDNMNGDHIGHYRYEEDDQPTMIYMKREDEPEVTNG
jgi:hypothetical protein